MSIYFHYLNLLLTSVLPSSVGASVCNAISPDIQFEKAQQSFRCNKNAFWWKLKLLAVIMKSIDWKCL